MNANDPDLEAIHQEEFGIFYKIADASLRGESEINFQFSSLRSQQALCQKLKTLGYRVRPQFELTYSISWRPDGPKAA
jgi:hypothetical protein